MGRKQTGLRNRHRSGLGAYSRKQKSRQADRYARWDSGSRKSNDVIGGHVLTYTPGN